MPELPEKQRLFFAEQLRETKKKLAVSSVMLVAVVGYESCRIRDNGFSVLLLPVWLLFVPLMAAVILITLKNYSRGRHIIVSAEKEEGGWWSFETITGRQLAADSVTQAEAGLQVFGSTYKAHTYYFEGYTWYLPLSKQ